MSLVSIAARNASLAMSYGASKGSLAPDNLAIALFAGDPDFGGTEISGGGYARVTVTNDGATWPDAPDGGSVTAAESPFAASTGSWSNTADFFQLYDADTGDAWDNGPLADPITVAGAGVIATPQITVFYEDPDLGA